ncbi:MAG TPA: hypothetical protein VEZ47_04230 [Gemmatirosa sp.]|nr:hypothetical protein [Gemmatirosa sp.]
MALWDKVKQELDRAGRVAQDALDEGKVRLDALRVRQLADKAAQHLGYAVYRASEAGTPLADEEMARYVATLHGHEAEAARLEARLADLRTDDRTSPGGAASAATPPHATGAPPSMGADDRGANI